MNEAENKAINAAMGRMRSSRVISFDIFDTLLGRTVASPQDVFRLMSKDVDGVVGYHVDDFVGLRKASEKLAAEIAFRDFGKEDVSLGEIYDQVAIKLGLSDEQKTSLMDVEMDWEARCLIPRAAGKYLFKRAKSLHKDIILVSDMYLPKTFLERVLRDNGYNGWVKFYLSADYGDTKRSGKLFDHVLRDFCCDPENVVHIGDNKNGDIAVPAKMGMKTIHIPRTVETFKGVAPFLDRVHKSWVRENRSLPSSIVAQAVSDQLFSCVNPKPKTVFDNDPFGFGYAALGPVVAGFTRWLVGQVEDKKIDRVVFLSRDGKVFYKNFLKEGVEGVSADYLYSSRRIVRMSTIRSEWDIETILKKPIYLQSFRRYAEYRFGLTEDKLDRSVLQENGITDPSDMLNSKSCRDMLKAIIMAHKERILQNSKEQRELYINYLKNAIKPGERVAVVDIGYAGTMQSEIIRMLGRDVYGFYLFSNEGTLNNDIAPDLVSGYMGDKTALPLSNVGLNTHRFLWETLVCSAESSFEGLTDEGGEVQLKFDEESLADYRKGFVRLSHAGALKFCDDIRERWPLDAKEFWLAGREAGLLLDEFITRPNSRDVSIFNDIEFEDKFGTENRRVLVASGKTQNDTRRKTLEIWKEGVVSRDRSSENSSQPLPGNSVGRLTRFEGVLIALLSSDKKRKKFYRNRGRFFGDSRYALLRLYGKATS